jgi:hypothetical protein
MKRIKEVTDTTKKVLEEIPVTRNSDDLLYLKVCERYNSSVLNMPFWYVFANRKALGIPFFESVRRPRQKLQAAYPELCGSDEVEAQRVVNEGIVRDYARRFSV